MDPSTEVGSQQQAKTYRARLDELGGLPAQARCLYLVMCKLSGKDPFCWGSVEYLAIQSGMKERQARTYIRQLETAGWVRCERRGLGQTNRYWFTEPDGHCRQPIAGQDRQPIAGQDRQPIAGQDRQPIAGHICVDLGAIPKSSSREQFAAAEQAAPANTNPRPPATEEERSDAAAKLSALHCPPALAESWVNQDAVLAIAAVGYLLKRRADPRLRPIRNSIGLLRAIMRDPRNCGFEWTGTGWLAPEDGLPTETHGEKKQRLERERLRILTAQAEASEIYRWRREAQQRWDALEEPQRATHRDAVRARFPFLHGRPDSDEAVMAMCLREMDEAANRGKP